MSESYVVRGAKVQCDRGSKITRLNLPQSHGVYVNDKPVLIDTDRVPGENIIPFGKCKKTKGQCGPSPAPYWKETQEDALIKGRPALLTKSFLTCTTGGKITIVTDGQN